MFARRMEDERVVPSSRAGQDPAMLPSCDIGLGGSPPDGGEDGSVHSIATSSQKPIQWSTGIILACGTS